MGDRLPSCVRCGGSLLLETDRYGVTLTCLQCGHVVYGETHEPISDIFDLMRPAAPHRTYRSAS